MRLKKLPDTFTVCKVEKVTDIDLNSDIYFIGKTDEELSLVCRTEDVPENTVERDDGWRGFRIEGVLDFSLIGILSKLSTILAENQIGIFAIALIAASVISPVSQGSLSGKVSTRAVPFYKSNSILPQTPPLST